jgi:hypothetical protein
MKEQSCYYNQALGALTNRRLTIVNMDPVQLRIIRDLRATLRKVTIKEDFSLRDSTGGQNPNSGNQPANSCLASFLLSNPLYSSLL